jgi:hypothetical protein
MSKKGRWGPTFIIILGLCFPSMDSVWMKYEVNEKDQLVMYDGFSGPHAIGGTGVSNEQGIMAVIGEYMSEFINWLLIGILIAPLFIASYIVLLSEKWERNKLKRKSTLAANGLAIACAITVWVRYIHLVNDTFRNVLF